MRVAAIDYITLLLLIVYCNRNNCCFVLHQEVLLQVLVSNAIAIDIIAIDIALAMAIAPSTYAAAVLLCFCLCCCYCYCVRTEQKSNEQFP